MSNKNKIWAAKAPSNIALVKYMGKSDVAVNQALNSSLSYTLSHLQSEVEVTLLADSGSDLLQNTIATLDQWQAWDKNSIQLSEKGKFKFLKHWQRCRQVMAPEFAGQFLLRSRNHFPSDCGLASSASSFAALTLAAYECFSSLKVLQRDWNLQELAQLSRQGSGSSCRSFFSPFVLWQGDQVVSVPAAYQKLRHLVVIVDDQVKKVSSSEAHKRVPSSLLYAERNLRAEKRTQMLLQALKEKNWTQTFEVTWADFWDMHTLFETSTPPFSYMLPESLKVLRQMQNHWETFADGPLVTMDAGANVHLLYRDDQLELAQKHMLDLTQRYKVFSDL